jgi:hypothetical protein
MATNPNFGRGAAAHPVPRAAAHTACPHCGSARAGTVIKRGAITVAPDPLEIFWNGKYVPLSPTEAQVFRTIAVRGKASHETIDRVLEDFGSSPATRPVVMMRIRRKFMALGGEDPFVRLGRNGVRLKIENDPQGSSATMVGLPLDPAGFTPARA